MNTTAMPNPLFATFCSAINESSAQLFSNNLARAVQGKFTELHLSLQSTGGFVGDGIYLYNLLKASPIPVIAYNLGSVQSVATIAFLGASKRIASKHAVFMIHRTRFTPQLATGGLLRELTVVADLEDKRTEALLRDHITLHGRTWEDLEGKEFWFTAEEAIQAGIVHSIGDFSPPMGSQLWSFTI